MLITKAAADKRDGNSADRNKGHGSHKGLLDQTTVAFMKIKSELPKFDVKTGDVRNYLKGLEMVFNDAKTIPSADWPRSFLFTINDLTAKEWITNNIINLKLNWEDAKKAFRLPFERAEYERMLLQLYN